MHFWLRRWCKEESGIASVEYALLIAFIGITIAVAMVTLATAVGQGIDGTTSELNK